MSYQQGSLRQVKRKDGLTWLFRYRVTKNGRRVENTRVVGLVQNLPTESSARKEVDRFGIRPQVNHNISASTEPTFGELALRYFAAEYGEDAEEQKADTTTAATKHYLFSYLVPEFGEQKASAIEPKAVKNWLKKLRKENHLAAPTTAKLKTTMGSVFSYGKLEKLCTNNPCKEFRTVAKSDYQPVIVRPDQARAILNQMKPLLHRVLVVVASLTGLRASELAGLPWQCVDFANRRIVVNKRWALGKLGRPKTDASVASVSMGEAIAAALLTWRRETPYCRPTDFVFASPKSEGKVPLRMSGFVSDHLRPAAIAAGVQLEKGQRFGLHNLRHSLSNWLVNKGKVQPKTVQGMMRHSKVQTTLDPYTQGDSDEMLAAQGQYVDAVGWSGLELPVNGTGA